MRSLLYSIAIIGVLLSGAAAADSNTSPRNYSREQAQRTRTVQEGVVVMVRPVRIDNRSTVNSGTVLGAAVGAGAAQRVKNRDARTAARIIGTTAGAVAGSAIQRSATRRQGVEIFIRTQSRNGHSNVISVVQDVGEHIRPGQYVLLTGGGRDVRVVPLAER